MAVYLAPQGRNQPAISLVAGLLKNLRAAKPALAQPGTVVCGPGCYNVGVTLVEVTYELQAPLKAEQLRALAGFANTYGLRRFRVNEQLQLISIEYDASRLQEAQVARVLRQANIPVALKV